MSIVRLLRLAAFTLALVATARAGSPPPLSEVARHALDRAADQYTRMLAQVAGQAGYPRTFEKGKLALVRPQDWTSGFFPGSLWYLYEATGDARWRDAAARYTDGLEELKTYGRTHDLGFMLYCSFGQGYRLTGDARYREILLQGAGTLATRFNPAVGCIKSWDHGAWAYAVIIDNMMNLELLTWAARTGREPRLRQVALTHADTTLANHFRPDHSTYHVIGYDPASGRVLARNTHQGAADSSAWARGQAWGLYGYTMMFRETRVPAYLDQARAIADFLINHPRMPADKVPYWDFDAPGIPDVPRDSAAAAIMNAALWELAEFVGPETGRRYREFAEAQLRSLAAPEYLAAPGDNGCFILKHATGHLPKKSEIDVPLVYGDYYFLEALFRSGALPAAR